MIAALVALLILLAPLPALSQTPSGATSGGTPGASPAQGTAGGASGGSSAQAGSGGAAPAPTGGASAGAAATPTPQDLVSSTLPSDISTASYYELVAWAQQLGLDDSGSRKDLQARLASHFGVTLPAAPTAQARTFTVKSAREARYYKTTGVEEQYAVLRGDVVVEVRDQKDGSVQTVSAATITYNQTRKTFTAEGDVTYTLTRGGETEKFTGQSLAFDLDTSEAVFYDGSTTRTAHQGTSDVNYSFGGKTISRLERLFEDFRFTSVRRLYSANWG